MGINTALPNKAVSLHMLEFYMIHVKISTQHIVSAHTHCSSLKDGVWGTEEMEKAKAES